MAEIVNLNKFRKLREREREKIQAAENRVRHGQPSLTRQQDAAERSRHRKDLDDKRLQGEPSSSEPPAET